MFRRFFLCRNSDVGVSVQRKSGAVVAQHFKSALDVYPIPERQDREHTPEIVEASVFQISVKAFL